MLTCTDNAHSLSWTWQFLDYFATVKRLVDSPTNQAHQIYFDLNYWWFSIQIYGQEVEEIFTVPK